MNGIRSTITALVSCTLILLLTCSVLGQFKETYQPPGSVLVWGSSGTGDGQFAAPVGVAADGDGNIYVVDSDNHRIQKFDNAGGYLAHWGSSGSGSGQFATPGGLAVDASGNVYVADTDNHRIQKFDSAGAYLGQWGSSGTANGQFSYPDGVAADVSGNIYVADTFNHRIQKFDSMGNHLIQWGINGSGAGEFTYPIGVAADPSGNVYVVDWYNRRIQKFDSTGNYLTEWGSNGSGAGQFSLPSGVAVDAMGSVYVADAGSDRIQKFDSAGNYLTEWGGSGSGPGQLDGPLGVAVDAFGNVYVAELNNNRVQKFAPALWFDLAGYDSHLSVSAGHETTAVRTLFRLENNGAPRFAFKNTSSDTEWSFQQSGPGNFLISREGTGGPETQVYQNGRVRMGPGGAINFDLAPNGDLTIAGGLTAKGSTFPDYVFEPDYPLIPLEEVGTFVRREKRLPGIPSAEEVQHQGGHNMTELQLKLLEKLEEMTLYTLDHHQRLNENDGEVEQLQAEVNQIKKALGLKE